MAQTCRTPSGVRGLKYLSKLGTIFFRCRTPSGVRGLKSSDLFIKYLTALSHPVRGAWIEIASILNIA